MMCGHAKEWIAASWTDALDAALKTKLRQHVSVCAECAAEAAQLGGLWDRLGYLPAPEPSQALTARWESTLESLSATRRQKSWKFSLAALWPERPVWQVSIAVACLAAGLLAGSYASRLLPAFGPGHATQQGEIDALREEVASTKEMVALSLLQQQSAGERLRGVDYSVRMRSMEPDVVSELIRAVNHDSSVNVRLAAIDALSRAAGNPQVRQSMIRSLGAQNSPMVQAALIDYLVDARDRAAVGTLRQFADREDLNPAVRQRAGRAMRQLTEYR